MAMRKVFRPAALMPTHSAVASVGAVGRSVCEESATGGLAATQLWLVSS